MGGGITQRDSKVLAIATLFPIKEGFVKCVCAVFGFVALCLQYRGVVVVGLRIRWVRKVG